jgi:hypothetical protein
VSQAAPDHDFSQLIYFIPNLIYHELLIALQYDIPPSPHLLDFGLGLVLGLKPKASCMLTTYSTVAEPLGKDSTVLCTVQHLQDLP